MTTTTHGGLVESALEAVGCWLRLAGAGVRQAALAHERGRPSVEAELHEAASERYEKAAQQAERLVLGCRNLARYHMAMSVLCRGEEERT